MISLALFQPDIPQNAGAILRTASCFNVAVHIIHPLGFQLHDKALRRAGMDYLDKSQITEHSDWPAFARWCSHSEGRLLALTTRATQNLFEFRFLPGDVLLLGRESAGLPPEVHKSANARLMIPQAAGTRSLNVSVAAGIALAQALQQTGTIGELAEINATRGDG